MWYVLQTLFRRRKRTLTLSGFFFSLFYLSCVVLRVRGSKSSRTTFTLKCQNLIYTNSFQGCCWRSNFWMLCNRFQSSFQMCILFTRFNIDILSLSALFLFCSYPIIANQRNKNALYSAHDFVWFLSYRFYDGVKVLSKQKTERERKRTCKHANNF